MSGMCVMRSAGGASRYLLGRIRSPMGNGIALKARVATLRVAWRLKSPLQVRGNRERLWVSTANGRVPPIANEFAPTDLEAPSHCSLRT